MLYKKIEDMEDYLDLRTFERFSASGLRALIPKLFSFLRNEIFFHF